MDSIDDDMSNYSIIPQEVTVEDILRTANPTPSQLYAIRQMSTDVYQMYRRSIRDWIVDPESWITAIINNDQFLYRDLQFLMSRGDVLINDYVEYDSDSGSMLPNPQYLRSYDDLKDIGITVEEIITAMYDNYSFNTFSEAMTNRRFRTSLPYLVRRNDNMLGMLVALAGGHRETLMLLVSVFKYDVEVMDSIVRTMIDIFGNKGAEDIVSILIESEIYLPDEMIESIDTDVNNSAYYADPAYVSSLLNEYAQTL